MPYDGYTLNIANQDLQPVKSKLQDRPDDVSYNFSNDRKSWSSVVAMNGPNQNPINDSIGLQLQGQKHAVNYQQSIMRLFTYINLRAKGMNSAYLLLV
jgi:hypothetical protein